jgi:hypothetical protein
LERGTPPEFLIIGSGGVADVVMILFLFFYFSHCIFFPLAGLTQIQDLSTISFDGVFFLGTL